MTALQSQCACKPSEGAGLTVAGEGERLPEVVADDRDLHTDPQALLQLLLGHRRGPHETRVPGALAARVRRPQAAHTHLVYSLQLTTNTLFTASS